MLQELICQDAMKLQASNISGRYGDDDNIYYPYDEESGTGPVGRPIPASLLSRQYPLRQKRFLGLFGQSSDGVTGAEDGPDTVGFDEPKEKKRDVPADTKPTGHL